MSTNDLYKELRTAMRSRDDAQVLRVLRLIVAADPADADAAQQLAEYETRAIQEANIQEESDITDDKLALTAPFYRKLRSAIRSNNLQEAHSCLTQILKIAPEDANAQEQIKEIGPKLVKAAEQELQDVLDSGDASAICRKVAELKSYCQDEEVLNSLSAWSAAAHIAEQKRLREMTAKLEVMFDALDSITELEARFKQVNSITKFAASERLDLTSSQASKVNAVRLAWKKQVHEQELNARYEDLINTYQTIKNQFIQTHNPLVCLASLDESEPKLTELAKEMDVVELDENWRNLRKRLQGTHQSMVRAKRAKRVVLSFVVLSVLLISGAVFYAYENVRSRHMALDEAHRQKNVVLVESMLNTQPYIVYISRKINSQYDALCNECLTWLDNWRRDSRQLKDFMFWLQSNEKNINQDNIDTHIGQFMRIKIFLDAYEKKYQLANQQDYKQHIDMFDNKIEEVRKSLLHRFTSFPSGTSLQILQKEKTFYQQVSTLFQSEQAKEIENAIVTAANQELRGKLPTSIENINVSQLREVKALYEQYKDSLKLDEEIGNKIANYENTDKWFKTLPAQLSRCHSLKDYIAVLQKNPEAYATLKGASLSSLENMRSAEDEVLARYAAYTYLSKHSPTEVSTPEKAHSIIDRAKKVYLEGKSLYEGRRPSAVESVIEKMTKYRKSLWTNDYKTLKKGNTVYIGTFSFINNVCMHTPCNSDGSLSKKRQKLGYASNKPESMLLKDVPERLHFKRMDLQRGIVLPVNLMQNVARYGHDSCPILARAYLFSLAVELMEALNSPTLSGLAWSASLRSDIKAFKRLIAESDLKEGSWVLSHSVSLDRKWENFFFSVKNHDYLAEIKKSLSNSMEGCTRFAGYVGPNREAELNVSVQDMSSLYVMHEGELKPFKPQHFSPYLPLYIIEFN